MKEQSPLTDDSVMLRSSSAVTGTEGTGAASVGWLPATIGKYRIIRLIGEGGMGVVYEAEQEQPRRIVALKVIKSGLRSPEVLRRFEQESHALGRLQHPGIAQIYEAGTADTGSGPQPYLAMELIRGRSLHEYTEALHLNGHERMQIMAKICEAVHHAHQRSLIHRDLKPANILVDETGQPKILDFGVARATDSDPEATLRTNQGQLLGTLAYMSPEQVTGDPLEVDTRSDIYALGVILYELLAEHLPYRISTSLPEALQTIREEEPAPLSSINRMYRGDIETIVAKALDKDKARRYGSAAEFAADIRRYLSDEPITARPPSVSYHLQKFARRHKALVTGIAVVFAVLVAGIVTSTWQAIRASRAEQEARAINEFLRNDLLAQARPDTNPDPDLKVRTALDRASTRIEGKFDKQPLVEASVRQTIGSTYTALSVFSEAQRHIERAVELRSRVLGEKDASTLESMQALATALERQGKFAKAEPLYMKILDMRRRVLGEEHPETLGTMYSLAATLGGEGKYAMSEAMYERLVANERRVLGEEHIDTLLSMANLATMYHLRGKYAEAESLYTTTIDAFRRLKGPEYPPTLSEMVNLAELYGDEGKYAQAEPVYLKVLEIQRRVLGENHRNTLYTLNGLAALYVTLGKNAEAEALYIKAVEGGRRGLGEEHPRTLESMTGLAETYRRQAKYVKAESLFNQVLESRRRVLGPEHPQTLDALVSLGRVHVHRKKLAEGEITLRTALNIYEKSNSDAWKRYYCQGLLGASLVGEEKYANAETLLLSSYDGMIRRQATIPAGDRAALQEVLDWIVKLYGGWGKPEKAAEWKQKVQSTSNRDK